MFLERKFAPQAPQAQRSALCDVLPEADWAVLPELVYDVLVNIQVLLKARRGYDHILPDYGLTASDGNTGAEAQVERLQRELPETLARYEPRFALKELDFEIEADGKSSVVVTGSILATPAGVQAPAVGAPSASTPRPLPGSFRFCFAATSRKILTLDYFPPGPVR